MTPTGSPHRPVRSTGTAPGATLPLVGRTREIAALERLLEGPAPPEAVTFLAGESGCGKSRLAAELAARAERRGWTVATGRSYPVERGVPYALLSDALVPLLRSLDADTLTVLSRGGDAELRSLFPALGPGRHPDPDPGAADPDEIRTRLFWSLAELLKGCASRGPLLVVAEDLHWADGSSLELLHFLARQCSGHPIVFVCTYDEAGRDRNPALVKAERSLTALGLGAILHVDPLSEEHLADLLSRVYAAEPPAVAPFASALFAWTRGNPFFVEEILKAVAAPGAPGAGLPAWVAWDAGAFRMPSSIRDAVLTGLASFPDDARATAELAAVIGTRAGYPLLARVGGLTEERLLAALEALCSRRILSERLDDGVVVYAFRHAVVRQTLYQELSLQRARVLHGAVAEAMEAHWGPSAAQHADELAYHYARADTDRLTDKAVTYLVEAGRRALDRHADREAADYLRNARERLEATGTLDLHPERVEVLRDLARACQRLGEHGAAVEAWEKAVALVAPGTSAEAELRQSLGLACFLAQRRSEAFAHLERGLAVVDPGSPRRVLLLLVRSQCHQELGQAEAAASDARAALEGATALGHAGLLARAHRTLALLHLWIGPPTRWRPMPGRPSPSPRKASIPRWRSGPTGVWERSGG